MFLSWRSDDKRAFYVRSNFPARALIAHRLFTSTSYRSELMRRQHLLALAFGAALSIFPTLAQTPASATVTSPATLKDAFKGAFYVGVAVNSNQITGADSKGDELIVQQFDSITPENVMKWEVIHPRPDAYDFSL